VEGFPPLGRAAFSCSRGLLLDEVPQAGVEHVRPLEEFFPNTALVAKALIGALYSSMSFITEA
jgi:hypothetical protein